MLVQFVLYFHVSEEMSLFVDDCACIHMTLVVASRVLATTHSFWGPTIFAYIYSASIGLKDTPVPVVVSNAVVAL